MGISGKRMPLRSAAIALGAACVALLVGEVVLQVRALGAQIGYSDFLSYYNAAVAVRHGGDPFASTAAFIAGYGPGEYGQIAQGIKFYVYAPAFALALLPLTLLPPQTAFAVWAVANLFFLVSGVYFLVRLATPRVSLLSVLVLAAAAMLTRVVRIELFLGQADIFTLWLIAAAFWARSRGWTRTAGVILGFACVTKPMLLALAAFLVWKREHRFALTSLMAFAVLLVAPFLWLGGTALHDQITAWQFWSNQYLPFVGNYAPKGELVRLFTVNPVSQPVAVIPALVTILWLLIAVIVVALTAAAITPEPLTHDLRTLLEVGLVVSASLLVSPLSEYIHLTLLLLPLIACACAMWTLGPRTKVGAVLAGGTFLLWIALCDPLHASGSGLSGSLVTTLGLPYSLILVATFALALYAICQTEKVSLVVRLRALAVSSPTVARAWLSAAPGKVK